jgi:hypothetical protein
MVMAHAIPDINAEVSIGRVYYCMVYRIKHKKRQPEWARAASPQAWINKSFVIV